MRHILTVDDGAANRRLLRAVLEAEAFSVVEAADGVEALAALEREPVDAIISDVLMPNMDGFRLCLEVRKHARFGALPFIIYTSTYNSPSDRKLALDAGADDYVVKPAPASTLLTALTNAQVRATSRERRPASSGDEFDVIKQYNAALVTKLEERNAELGVRNFELRASEERFRQLAESIHEVFWLMDPERGAMLYVSPAYEKIWGRSVSSLLAAPRTWLDAVHTDDRARIEQAAPARQARGDYDEQYRIVRADGAIRWIRDRAFPVRNDIGAVYRIAGVAEDVTERKELEEQFRQAQKLEAVGQLAGGVAHDFNNLLSVILMRVAIMSEEAALAPEIAEGMREIHDAATRAANLTRQLLMFSRRQTMRVQRLDVNEVVSGVLLLIRRIIGEHIVLESCDSPGPLPVSGDAGMLEQVVMNLVVNARDAMSQGGRVRITLDEVEYPVAGPAPRRAGRYVRLVVEDSGTGISPEVLPRIFEPFFTTKEAGRGTGLGLATVYGIVQQHQGWIEVSSIVGQGASFVIHLPRAVDADESRGETPRREGAMRGTETILVVEDEPGVRRLVAMALTRHGYHVLEAADATAALDVWNRHRDDINLLLTDLVLPGGISGRQLAQRLRSERPALAVIYSSGYREHSAADGFVLEPGEVFLAKPFELAHLAATMREQLDRASPRGR